MVEVGKAIRFLGRMTTNDPEFEIEGYEGLTSNKNELEALNAGEDAVRKTADLTVENNSGTFGPDMDGEEKGADGVIENKSGNNGGSKKGKGSKFKELENKLDVAGVTGKSVKLNTSAEKAEKRSPGGQIREKDRK